MSESADAFSLGDPELYNSGEGWLLSDIEANYQATPSLLPDSIMACEKNSACSCPQCSTLLWTSEVQTNPNADRACQEPFPSNATDCQRFRCKEPDCSASYSKKDKLKKHIASKHLGDRPFACNIGDCQKAFGTSSDCKRHQRTHQKNHNTISPFVCKDCTKSFSRHDSMLEHRRKRCKVVQAQKSTIDEDEATANPVVAMSSKPESDGRAISRRTVDSHQLMETFAVDAESSQLDRPQLPTT